MAIDFKQNNFEMIEGVGFYGRKTRIVRMNNLVLQIGLREC
jgi:hypothetical protein